MKIDRIYVNTHRYDSILTATCVASIRYWYPDIPVSLIFDHSNGENNYGKLCRVWNVGVLDTQNKKYGWGFGKFEPLFLDNGEYFMVLDADTVFSGPVLDGLRAIDADFVVDRETQPDDKQRSLYYDPKQVEKLYPPFKYPGYSFNTGQWIGRSGVIRPSDFDDLVSLNPAPRLRHPEVFKQADQGIFNFLIQRKEQEGKVFVVRMPLMIWPDNGAGDFIQLSAIKDKRPDHPYVIHWAGMKFRKLRDYNQGDILSFYNNYYYSRFSKPAEWNDKLQNRWLRLEKKLRNRLKTFKPAASK